MDLLFKSPVIVSRSNITPWLYLVPTQDCWQPSPYTYIYIIMLPILSHIILAFFFTFFSRIL